MTLEEIKVDSTLIKECRAVLSQLEAQNYSIVSLADNNIFGVSDMKGYSQSTQDEILAKAIEEYGATMAKFAAYVQLFMEKFS